MRDLVAEVAEQGAVKFAHLAAHALALGVVGFGDIERDQAVVVSGHHRRAGGGSAGIEKIERQWIGVFVLCVERQAELEQRVEQAVLRHLDEAPAPRDSPAATNREWCGCAGRRYKTDRPSAPGSTNCMPRAPRSGKSDSAALRLASACHSSPSGRSAVMVCSRGK